MAREVKAYEIKYSDNIYWYGNLYTVLAVETDYEDETVTFNVGYPRVLEHGYPILNKITTNLQNLVMVYR